MDELGPWRDASTLPDRQDRWCYGCIRLGTGTVNPDGTFSSGTGPYIHANPAHLTVGLVSTRITDTGMLRVQLDGTGPIGTIIVTGDESVAERHIMIGASGGPQWFDISFYTGTRRLLLNVQADYNVVKDQFLNLWVAAVYPLVRGTGQPSLAQQALDAIAALEARVTQLETAGA